VARVPDYNFLCGILCSRESGFVTAARLESILSARTFTEAVAQLPDGPFAVEVRRAPEYGGLERGARAETGALCDLLSKYAPSPDLEALLIAPLDWFNLKVAVLQKLTGRRDERLPGPEGSLRFSALEAMAESGRYEGLPRSFAVVLGTALAARIEAGTSTQAFELALDRGRDLALLECARRVSRDLGAHRAEAADLSAAVAFARASMVGIPWAVARYAFTGHADEARFEELAGLKPAEWPARLGGISSPVIRELIAAVASGGEVTELAAARRRTLAARIRDWRFRPPSAEYAYWWMSHKLADLANLRLALVCRLNGLPEAETRKRIDDGLL
jgi:vacuolar-type H+-ATPase subunit C/Vma6